MWTVLYLFVYFIIFYNVTVLVSDVCLVCCVHVHVIVCVLVGWTLGISVPAPIYWLYVVEIAFYLHSAYAMIFIEIVRRDFTVMMIHHFVTIALLGYSLAVR